MENSIKDLFDCMEILPQELLDVFNSSVCGDYGQLEIVKADIFYLGYTFDIVDNKPINLRKLNSYAVTFRNADDIANCDEGMTVKVFGESIVGTIESLKPTWIIEEIVKIEKI